MRDDEGYNENGLLEGEVELWRNSQWRVTSIALEDASGRTSCPYWIPVQQLHWDGLQEHMAKKTWVDIGLFNEAMAKARELHPRQVAA